MTVPQQRQPPGDPSLNGVILDTVRQVQTAVDRLAERFDTLGDRFMPRVELTARFDESLRDRADLRAELVQERTERKAQDERLQAAVDEAEKRRISERRYAIGALLTIVGLVLTLLGLVLTLYLSYRQ